MEKRIVNPWSWQDAVGYAQAIEVKDATYTLYLAGQAAMSAEGAPSEADMAGQIAQCMDNVEAVLKEAGYSLADIIRLNVYTTNTDECLASFGEVVGRLAPHGCRPAATLLGVESLAFPSLKVEIEVTAAR